ncbi:alginate lyase family protein [Crassaminicella profunda]|uniref:alginate lyase family protein n=1 Tax=Crassaminicella profunda TaxID=1286698 RepID=UPI001CA60738|nr:alginate lyase family protein [Crassaminicella profunda]QZY55330.1 heparinase II/III family protein [Crassaminicella profunda]
MNKLQRYMKKAKDMPLDVLVKKVAQKTADRIYYIAREQMVKRKPIDMDDKLFKGFQGDINFLFDTSNKDYYIEQLRKLDQEQIIIKQADKICNHMFDLLGSGDTDLGKNIKWNQDFKSGFIWENQFYKKIKAVDLNNDADVKVPWELSRFQHIPTLGQAYLLTNDEKYAKEFQEQIEDWISKNPVEMSVNWTCAMDVAIRACNWIVGIYYFKDNKEINQVFWMKLNKWLYLHGKFIYKNLEKGTINNNHYLSDLVGLVWLGIYFKNFNKEKSNIPKEWLDYGVKELEIEIQKQVYEDGCNYEASTAYHCLVTELLLYTIILCDKNHINFSHEFMTKIEKMCEVIMNITKPNGWIPLIGDMDSGRFIMFTGYGNEEMRDFRYLLRVGAEFFDRDDFRVHADNKLAAIWMFKKVKESKNKDYKLKSISYPDGGLHILRNDRVYMIIRCGQNGTAGRGGHTHNDQLSFELNVDGEDFIVDPGTYVYTADYKMRNLFRSTAYHNTLKIEGFEQNDFSEFDLFEIKDETNAQVVDCDKNYFRGKHFGYQEKAGIIHEREFLLGDNAIQIEDGFTIIQAIKMGQYIKFYLNEDVKVDCKNGLIYLKNQLNTIKISFDKNIKLKVKHSYVSKGYGVNKESKVISFHVNNQKKFMINIEIVGGDK